MNETTTRATELLNRLVDTVRALDDRLARLQEASYSVLNNAVPDHTATDQEFLLQKQYLLELQAALAYSTRPPQNGQDEAEKEKEDTEG